MAIRQIRIQSDPVLRKKAREVREITPTITKLLDDMAETMYDAQGVGLAAPQIGISKRLVVIDVQDEKGLLKLINQNYRPQRRKQLSKAVWFPGIAGK